MRKVNSTKMYGSVQVKSNISLTVVLDEVWGHFHTSLVRQETGDPTVGTPCLQDKKPGPYKHFGDGM